MLTHWIPADKEEPIEEHELDSDFFFQSPGKEQLYHFLGGNFAFVQVLVDKKPMYLLVNDIGAQISLPVNPRATDYYHNAVVKERAGKNYCPEDWAQIYGPAVLCKEELR